MSDIEGKVARVSDERVGKRTSFKFSQPVNRIHPANCLDSVDRITTQERPDIVWRIAIWRSQLAHAPRADWRAPHLQSPRRPKADYAAFFFATAFLATMTSGNSTTRAGASVVPFSPRVDSNVSFPLAISVNAISASRSPGAYSTRGSLSCDSPHLLSEIAHCIRRLFHLIAAQSLLVRLILAAHRSTKMSRYFIANSAMTLILREHISQRQQCSTKACLKNKRLSSTRELTTHCSFATLRLRVPPVF